MIAAGVRARADECVMCGLCLPHCPTFRLSGLETRSPRGRIALAKVLEPGVAMDASVREALESCLQCRACEAVCPASVRYGEIVEGARAVLGPGQAVIATLATRHPRLVASGLGVIGRLARRLPMATRHLGRRARWLLRADLPLSGDEGDARAGTLLFTGCVARSLEADAQRALLRIAAALGIPLGVATEAGCCGAQARHVGDLACAQRLAAHNARAWTQHEAREIVALDSGCVMALRTSANNGARIVEACRWLLDREDAWGPKLRRIDARIGLWLPCTHRNQLRDARAATELLKALPGVEVVPVDAGHGCCGAAGPQLLAHPAQADALVAPLVEAIAALRVDALATTNVGCAMHLAERLLLRSVKLPVIHPLACLAQRLSEPVS